MKLKNNCSELNSLLIKGIIPAGYTITKAVELEPLPESSKYSAQTFSLNDKKVVYRKAKVTKDRPGAFLAIWQRPSVGQSNDNKPIALKATELDYLLIQVESDFGEEISKALVKSDQRGIFIFPVSLLIEKGIVSSIKSKGKTGFRVFPPWSKNRGVAGTKVFSESGKKTQRWQLPYFLFIDDDGFIDPEKLNNIINLNSF